MNAKIVVMFILTKFHMAQSKWETKVLVEICHNF